MIRLFPKDATVFTTLGIGVLKDAITAVVKETLNGAFEFEFTYPLGGKLFDEIEEKKIVVTKPNQIDSDQAFRIYEISRPINGIITVSCEHISYDMSGYPVGAIEAESLADAITKIQNGIIGPITSPFSFYTDKASPIAWTTDKPTSMRSLLSGGDNTLQKIYGGEFKFDNFVVNLLNARGLDRGFCIRYGKQMTDIESNTNSENLYTAVFPFYYSKTKETVTTDELTYEQMYIVPGSTPLSKTWLSLTDGGEPLVTMIQDVPVQIASEGEYHGNVYQWDSTNETWYIPDPIPEPSIKKSTSTKEDVITYVTLPETYIWIGQGAHETCQRVLTLDMTSEFSSSDNTDQSTGELSPPTADMLRSKTMSYLDKTKIGQLTHEIDVSFVDLSKYMDRDDIGEFEKIGLGDTVQVIFEELGLKASKTVVSYEFDVISDRYSSVTIGDKETSLSETALTSNDNISSLTNDMGYCDRTTVNELIAKTVTADYIQAMNASLSNAQIAQLETERIKCTGIMEASQFDIDKVVSNLIVAQNAEIYQTLLAGNIKVKGEITATSGTIGGCTIANGVLEVANANITGQITAGKIVVDDVVYDGLRELQNEVQQGTEKYENIQEALNVYNLTAAKMTVGTTNNVIFAADSETNNTAIKIGSSFDPLFAIMHTESNDTVTEYAKVHIKDANGNTLLKIDSTAASDANKVIINADVAVAKSILVGTAQNPIFYADSTSGNVAIDIKSTDSQTGVTTTLFSVVNSPTPYVEINGQVLTGQIPIGCADDAIDDRVTAAYVNALNVTASNLVVTDGTHTIFTANAQTHIVNIGPFSVANGALTASTGDSSGVIKVIDTETGLRAGIGKGSLFAYKTVNDVDTQHLYINSNSISFNNPGSAPAFDASIYNITVGSSLTLRSPTLHLKNSATSDTMTLTNSYVDILALVKFNGGNIVSTLPNTAPAGAVYFLKNS